MKKIKLTQGKIALVDKIDFENIPELKKYRWCYKKGRSQSTGYATRRAYLGDGIYEEIKMHRLILGLKKGDGKQVDHEDGNGLNNRRLNLRVATPNQNGMNRKPYGSSKYLGVSLIRRKNGRTPYWSVNITIDGTRYTLGSFKNTKEGEKKAALLYNEYAIKRDKEFARLNTV